LAYAFAGFPDHRPVRCVLVDSQGTLQDAFCPLHRFSRFQTIHQLNILVFKPGSLDFRSNQKPDHRRQAHLFRPVMVRYRAAERLSSRSRLKIEDIAPPGGWGLAGLEAVTWGSTSIANPMPPSFFDVQFETQKRRSRW
jgi:hypothetical protein